MNASDSFARSKEKTWTPRLGLKTQRSTQELATKTRAVTSVSSPKKANEMPPTDDFEEKTKCTDGRTLAVVLLSSGSDAV